MKTKLVIGCATAALALGACASQPETQDTPPPEAPVANTGMSGSTTQSSSQASSTTQSTAQSTGGTQSSGSMQGSSGMQESSGMQGSSSVPGSSGMQNSAMQASAGAQSQVEGVVVAVDPQQRTLTVREDGTANTDTYYVTQDTDITFRRDAVAPGSAMGAAGIARPIGEAELTDVSSGDEVLLRFEERDGRRMVSSVGNRQGGARTASDAGAADSRAADRNVAAAGATGATAEPTSDSAGSRTATEETRTRVAAADEDEEVRPDRLPDTSTSLGTWALLGSLFAFAGGLGLRRVRARR